MFFKTIKNSFSKFVKQSGRSESEEDKPQIRSGTQVRLDNVYNYVLRFKTAFTAQNLIMDVQKAGFDPYCYVPMNPEEEAEMLETYYDTEDRLFNESVSEAKGICVMASSCIGSVAHTIAWGAMAAIHYVYTSVPITISPSTVTSVTPATHTNKITKNTTDFFHTMNSVNEKIKKKEAKIKSAERHIRVPSLEAIEAIQEKAYCERIVSYGDNQQTSMKHSSDEALNFDENYFSVNRKPTMPPPEPPRATQQEAVSCDGVQCISMKDLLDEALNIDDNYFSVKSTISPSQTSKKEVIKVLV